MKRVRGTHATAVDIHRGAVGPECSVVRWYDSEKNNRTPELPNHRTFLEA